MPESSRPVIWSSEARSDLSEIWNYYLQAAGRPTADRIVREIARTCQLLEDQPFGGRSRDEIKPGLRSSTGPGGGAMRSKARKLGVAVPGEEKSLGMVGAG
jgi:plasmid stabilization system protein ParE